MKRFLHRILQEIMKKIILETSDAWSMRRSSHQPSVLYWRLSDFKKIRYTSSAKKMKSSCRLLDQHHAKNWTLKQKFQQRKEVGRLCHEKGSILMTRENFFLCRSNYFLISHYLATSKSMKRIVGLIHSEICAIFFL